ncbi:unnamed protein product [Polarella glacialis]|uniref:STAS domain-containing protein n=2 Tax=Polarella glacialis TaxID=89957 RepID=A0A813F9C3_POLGL|nr:unnamed protein product [Polarella glacialis]
MPWDIPAFQGLIDKPHRLNDFLLGGVLVALTSFLTTYATTKKMALKHGYDLDASQEMIALGFAGVGGSFFGAFPPSGSLSRTGLAADCGVKTQLGGVFAAGVVGLGLCFLTPALVYLPKAALAAIIMKSTLSLIDFEMPWDLYMKYWKAKRMGGLKRDLLVWIIAFTFTLGLGVLYGIACAVVLSIGLILKDAVAPKMVVLGRVDHLNQWRNIEDWPEAKTYEGLLVVEFRGPLSFASADHFQETVQLIRHQWQSDGNAGSKIVVISLVAVHYIDATAISMLDDLLTEWKLEGVGCIISGAKHQVRLLIEDKLVRRKGANSLLDQVDFMITIDQAIHLAEELKQDYFSPLKRDEAVPLLSHSDSL